MLRAAFPMMDSTQLEFVQPRRIVYEDFLAHRSVRRPRGQEIEDKPQLPISRWESTISLSIEYPGESEWVDVVKNHAIGRALVVKILVAELKS